MSKNHKILLIAAAVVIGGYLLIRWYENRQMQQEGSPGGFATGSNLNSLAPELVGGSSGPSVGPALVTPVNITITDSHSPTDQDTDKTGTGGKKKPPGPPDRDPDTAMISANPVSTNPLMSQAQSAGGTPVLDDTVTGVQDEAPVAPNPAAMTSAGTGSTADNLRPSGIDQRTSPGDAGGVRQAHHHRRPVKRPSTS